MLVNMARDAGQKQSVYKYDRINANGMELWSVTCSKRYIEEVQEVPQQLLKLWSMHMNQIKKTIMFASSHVALSSQKQL